MLKKIISIFILFISTQTYSSDPQKPPSRKKHCEYLVNADGSTVILTAEDMFDGSFLDPNWITRINLIITHSMQRELQNREPSHFSQGRSVEDID